jgi:hypothetical protein
MHLVKLKEEHNVFTSVVVSQTSFVEALEIFEGFGIRGR